MDINNDSPSADKSAESIQLSPVVVSLDVVWAGSASKHDARMSEISMKGCFIDSKAQGRNLGDKVDFKVRLPDGPWVSLHGEVVHNDYPMGFELRFVGLTEADNRLLAQVVLAHGKGLNQSTHGLVSEARESENPPAPLATPHRVLIADDDPLTLRMLSAIVKSEGYEVVSVADGREALKTLQHDSAFCAAIFDMSMPHLKGLDLILFMKADERLRGIPVGMITAEQDPKVWDDSIAAGASVFLPKPFAPPQVGMMLRMLATKIS